MIMKVYVLTEHWYQEIWSSPDSTILGVYSCITDAEDKQNELLSKVDPEDQGYVNGYEVTVQEFTINNR
jgi:hypothetical protein